MSKDKVKIKSFTSKNENVIFQFFNTYIYPPNNNARLKPFNTFIDKAKMKLFSSKSKVKTEKSLNFLDNKFKKIERSR